MATKVGLVVVLVCGCGRIGFDPQAASTDATSGFCAAQPPSTFCSDFDVATDFSDWGPSYLRSGTYALGPNAHSPPWAMHVSNDMLATSSDSSAAHLAHVIDGSATYAVASLDVRIAEAGQSGPALFALQYDDGTVAHGIEYVYRPAPDLSFIEEARTTGTMATVYDNYTVSAPLPVGEWHRITIELALGVSPSTVVVRYDGQEVLTSSLVGMTAGSLTLYGGLVYLAGPSAPWQIDLDNVVVAVQ